MTATLPNRVTQFGCCLESRPLYHARLTAEAVPELGDEDAEGEDLRLLRPQTQPLAVDNLVAPVGITATYCVPGLRRLSASRDVRATLAASRGNILRAEPAQPSSFARWMASVISRYFPSQESEARGLQSPAL